MAGTWWRRLVGAAVIAGVLAAAACSDEPSRDEERGAPKPSTPPTAEGDEGRISAAGASDANRYRVRRFCEASARFAALDALLDQKPAVAQESIVRVDFDSLRAELTARAPDALQQQAADVTAAAAARVADRAPTSAEASRSDAAAKAIASFC